MGGESLVEMLRAYEDGKGMGFVDVQGGWIYESWKDELPGG